LKVLIKKIFSSRQAIKINFYPFQFGKKNKISKLNYLRLFAKYYNCRFCSKDSSVTSNIFKGGE